MASAATNVRRKSFGINFIFELKRAASVGTSFINSQKLSEVIGKIFMNSCVFVFSRGSN
jgi:hypothetical protein